MSREPDGVEVRVRIKATGQVLEMVPIAARALLNGGTAELVDEPAPLDSETKASDRETKPASIETAQIKGRDETATARDQRKPPKTRSAR